MPSIAKLRCEAIPCRFYKSLCLPILKVRHGMLNGLDIYSAIRNAYDINMDFEIRSAYLISNDPNLLQVEIGGVKCILKEILTDSMVNTITIVPSNGKIMLCKFYVDRTAK